MKSNESFDEYIKYKLHKKEYPMNEDHWRLMENMLDNKNNLPLHTLPTAPTASGIGNNRYNIGLLTGLVLGVLATGLGLTMYWWNDQAYDSHNIVINDDKKTPTTQIVEPAAQFSDNSIKIDKPISNNGDQSLYNNQLSDVAKSSSNVELKNFNSQGENKANFHNSNPKLENTDQVVNSSGSEGNGYKLKDRKNQIYNPNSAIVKSADTNIHGVPNASNIITGSLSLDKSSVVTNPLPVQNPQSLLPVTHPEDKTVSPTSQQSINANTSVIFNNASDVQGKAGDSSQQSVSAKPSTSNHNGLKLNPILSSDDLGSIEKSITPIDSQTNTLLNEPKEASGQEPILITDPTNLSSSIVDAKKANSKASTKKIGTNFPNRKPSKKGYYHSVSVGYLPLFTKLSTMDDQSLSHGLNANYHFGFKKRFEVQTGIEYFVTEYWSDESFRVLDVLQNPIRAYYHQQSLGIPLLFQVSPARKKVLSPFFTTGVIAQYNYNFSENNYVSNDSNYNSGQIEMPIVNPSDPISISHNTSLVIAEQFKTIQMGLQLEAGIHFAFAKGVAVNIGWLVRQNLLKDTYFNNINNIIELNDVDNYNVVIPDTKKRALRYNGIHLDLNWRFSK